MVECSDIRKVERDRKRQLRGQFSLLVLSKLIERDRQKETEDRLMCTDDSVGNREKETKRQ